MDKFMQKQIKAHYYAGMFAMLKNLYDEKKIKKKDFETYAMELLRLREKLFNELESQK